MTRNRYGWNEPPRRTGPIKTGPINDGLMTSLNRWTGYAILSAAIACLVWAIHLWRVS